MKCWEARQVADVDGTEKAFEVLRAAFYSMEEVEDKSGESFKLTKGLYLHSEGDILWRNRDYKKALQSLESSLTLSEELLKEHADIARCYNAIGNCLSSLNQPMKALEFYQKAYKMQEKLSGSEHHLDMVMYKNQIGTGYEGLGDYEKAVEYYRGALKLLKELKLSGFWDEAYFCRNLANALMHQKKISEAVEPADRAYEIRMKLLKNHPLTVQSIFQRAVVQANLADFEKALQLFHEAWEMEKSLGVGNHSDLWRKIITGVEHMCIYLKDGKQKEQFREDAFEFCYRFWEEQKASYQFTFNEYNKDIIDALVDLVGDKEAKHEIQKEQLWFYEGMYNANEEYFEVEFDLQTDNDALNEMLQERDELLDKVIGLCVQLDEHERLAKHKTNKLTLYKKLLVKPDFLGKKEYGLDKASLKTKVEQLYKDVGQEKSIIEFQENLLHTWQKQWEKGKRSAKFTFNEYNKDIIDALVDLVGDKKAKQEKQKEQLWFYEGMYNANEEDFHEQFDQQTDNDSRNEMLKERDELLDEVIRLCAQLDEHERLAKHKTNKLTLYKKVLVKPDFLGNKEYGLDKASLKTKVEQLYRDKGQEKSIVEFQENLLYTWQRQWEEGKSEAKTRKIGVDRERTIDRILQLCKELKKEAIYRQYGQEALSFFDEMWEVKHVNMENPEMMNLLRKLKELASSIGDYRSEKLYKDALQVGLYLWCTFKLPPFVLFLVGLLSITAITLLLKYTILFHIHAILPLQEKRRRDKLIADITEHLALKIIS